ncbi:HAD family hydrolase [Streptomyces sp. NPDC051219]|uniref:HAD family hydrolase n=1 Tax=Streptomyces sp. NPDC051219 TaxID=3155283 RepID=UPI0034173055
MPIRAVLWDIDDTLFDYAGADTTGMQSHLTAEGLADGYESVGEALAVWRELTELHWARFAAGGVSFQQQRRDRVRDFLGGASLSDAEADEWFDRYITHYRAAWAIFPDVLPVLDILTPRYRHGVLSNSSTANQDHKLRTLGLRDRFEVLLCAEDLGVSKPAAGAFLAACQALGLPPCDIAYVGDKIDIDACGARDAGLTGVWLDRSRTSQPVPPGVHRITALDQLPALLHGYTRFGAPSAIG